MGAYNYAPVAQLDRAGVSQTQGREFESHQERFANT